MKDYREVIEEFNKKKVRYAIIRNYEFLTDHEEKQEADLDILIHEKDLNKADITLKKFKFTRTDPKYGFSKKHIGYRKYIKIEQRLLTFDIQLGGIYWNDIQYLSDEQILKSKEKNHFFYTLSKNDSYIMYICHSILGKRNFKPKYKKRLHELQQDIDEKYVLKNLTRIFGERLALAIQQKIRKGNFRAIEKQARSIAARFVIRNPKRWFAFLLLSIRWGFSPKFSPIKKIPLLRCILPGTPMITLMGPDGSGKSTNADMLKNVFEKNDKKATIIYTGRGKSNIIPIGVVGKVYKKAEKKNKIKKKSKIKRFLFTAAAPIYTIDFLLRYFFRIFPQKKNNIFVITDRYASDILLMPNVPLWLKKILLVAFPKPKITFFLYNSPKALYARKPEHPIAELERQMELFKILTKRFNAIMIKTENLEDDFEKIAEKTFLELQRFGY